MRKYFFITCLLLLSLATNAQIKVQGNVIDPYGKVLKGASVSLIDPSTNAVLTYTTSDESGNYTLSLQTELTEVTLRSFLFNHQRFETTLVAESQLYPIVLDHMDTQLEEIFIKASPIVQKNDTIVFDLNSFASKNDRVLQDVLKKMPGMEVSESGEIKYQGESINKFYVEGKDLMQGSYSAITKALPNLHISKLEVYENHQPIKMLEGKIPSSSPAINIRLKNKVSLSGSGSVAAGGDPFIYSVIASPMFFSKDLQFLISFDSNNAGLQPQQRFVNFSIAQSFDAFRYFKGSTKLLSIATLGNPSIDQKRYLNNKTNAVSANFLNEFKDKTTLNTNIYYYNNYIKQDALQTTSIAMYNPVTGSFDPIVYQRENDNHLFSQDLQAKFTLTKNTKENYIKNILTFDLKHNKDRSLMLLNKEPINQNLTFPNFNIQNTFSGLIPVGNKRFANFRSLVDYGQDKQNYLVETHGNLILNDPLIQGYNDFKQRYDQRKFYTHNAISMSWMINRWTLTSEYSIQYESADFNTKLFGIDNGVETLFTPTYANDLSYSQVINELSNSLSFESRKWKLRFSLPLAMYNFSLKDRVEKDKNSKNQFNFLPSTQINYTLNSMWTLRAGSRLSKSFTPLNQLYPNFVFSGLNFSAYQSKIHDSRTWSNNAVVEFKNPFNGIFANARVLYSTVDKNIMLSQEIQENGQQIIKAIDKDNTTTSLTTSVTLGKFFSDLSTNVKLGFTNMDSKSYVILNEEFSKVKNQNTSYSLSLTNNYLSWLNVNYEFSYGQSSRNSLNTKVFTYQNSSVVKVDVIPLESHSISYGLDYRESIFNSQVFANRFMDLQYRYKWNKRKIDLELEWQNILNQKEYSQVIINEIQTTASEYTIRPSQILLRVRFTF